MTHQTHFEKLLSFLQGASWALALAGAFYSFLVIFPFGLIAASLVGLFFFLIGLVFVVIFVVAQLQIDKLNELKRQTYLLEKRSTHDQKLSDY